MLARLTMRWRHAASCTWMYRHGRPDVVCVVSSEFLFLLPPFFAAPTVFLSHPRPFFPRFFLSLFRSPITYLRSSGAQLPLAAPRLHAFDTINDPSSARDRRWNHLSFRFSGKKNEVAPTPDQGSAPWEANGHKGGRRGERRRGGQGTYRQNSIGIFQEIYLLAQWRGFPTRTNQLSDVTFPVSFTSINFDFHRVACTTTVPIQFQPPLRDRGFGQVIPGDDFETRSTPLPLLRDRASVSKVIKRNDKCNYASTVPRVQYLQLFHPIFFFYSDGIRSHRGLNGEKK